MIWSRSKPTERMNDFEDSVDVCFLKDLSPTVALWIQRTVHAFINAASSTVGLWGGNT